MNCVPVGASGVRLKSKAPLSWASDDSLGLINEDIVAILVLGGANNWRHFRFCNGRITDV